MLAEKPGDARPRTPMIWLAPANPAKAPAIPITRTIVKEALIPAESPSKSIPLSALMLKGKKLLLVNTASACGYTGQYAELEELYKKYKDQLVIIGFPANDFKQQEQKNDEEIAEFCKVNYGVTFLLAKKSSVIKGAEQHPVFAWLSDAGKNGWNDEEPTWNFCKYLVDEEGILKAFFPQTVSPLDKSVVQLLVK